MGPEPANGPQDFSPRDGRLVGGGPPFVVLPSPPSVVAVPGRASVAGTRRFSDRAQRERKLPSKHFRTGAGGLPRGSVGRRGWRRATAAAADRSERQAVSI